jgi:integrase
MRHRQKCKIVTKTKQGDKWTGRYVSNATINREMNSIKGLFRYLKRVAKVIKENPCEDLDELKTVQAVKIPPTQEQEAKIMELASADYDFFVMIVMIDTLGTRLGEVNNLKWQNVHLESSNLFEYGYVDFVKRKNNKNLRLPLSEELQILLSNMPRLSEYVFTNPNTGTKYTNRYKKLNTILEEVGIKDFGIGYHIFRHNAAAKLEQSGVEASTIKDILGNSTNVVLSTYLNQGIKRKQEVINLNSQRIKKYINLRKNIIFRQNLDKINEA